MSPSTRKADTELIMSAVSTRRVTRDIVTSRHRDIIINRYPRLGFFSYRAPGAVANHVSSIQSPTQTRAATVCYLGISSAS